MTATRYAAQPWHPALIREFHPTGRLLEIGCGAGTDHFELAKTAAETYAVDLAQEGVDLTNARLRLAGLPANARVADAEGLPFPNGFFDEVYSFGVIHHTDHPARVAAEMARVMRPGGRFLVGLYHRFSLFAAQKAVGYVLQKQHEGWRDYLARIEFGADQLDHRPRVQLFSQREAKQLFSETGEFANLSTRTVHPYFGRGWSIPGPVARRVGWYVIVTGRRL
jgi:SAM-dependent methyltransferase